MTSRDTVAASIVLGRSASGICAVDLNAEGQELSRHALAADEVAGWIERREHGAVRWVWSDTASWYPGLLAAGVRVARCHDLRLVHAILRDSDRVHIDHGLRNAAAWDAAGGVQRDDDEASLFDLDPVTAHRPPDAIEDALDEFARQRAAIDAAHFADRIRLLVAAESAGALLAVELRAAGLPWDATAHDAILTDLLGPRSAVGGVPERIAALSTRVREALGDPGVSLESQPKLLRALHRVGVMVDSTSRWELARHAHPAIEPLIEYKRLTRLWTANGWTWLSEWIRDGRFRPVYVPAGVVTGRWASAGGGALQIPRQLRAAVRADPGWVLVIADVAQLEPRVLAAMSKDERMARAARGRDLYAGIVESGALETRTEAKVALLGAMYGATAGDGGRLMPTLRRLYPAAMGLVDDAARTGERGDVVTTWLGRSSPVASAGWRGAQAAASEAGASTGDETRARRWARDRGRFTRNFVVQGTAAEWALVWLADLRARLWAMPPVQQSDAASRSGPVFGVRPHIAFFLHDEILVHTPAQYAEAVADAIRDAAASAGRRLFGAFPVDFALDVTTGESAAKN